MFFKKKKTQAKASRGWDQFDASLVHVGGDIPQELFDHVWDKYFVPMLGKALYVGPKWDGRDNCTRVIRFKANGRMHTRVILLNNSGSADEAVDVDGRMGDLLWVLVRRDDEDESK